MFRVQWHSMPGLATHRDVDHGASALHTKTCNHNLRMQGMLGTLAGQLSGHPKLPEWLPDNGIRWLFTAFPPHDRRQIGIHELIEAGVVIEPTWKCHEK